MASHEGADSTAPSGSRPGKTLAAVDTLAPLRYFRGPTAQVAELVDAPDSGSGGLKTVEVRILSWAHGAGVA